MTAPHDDTAIDQQSIIAQLRADLDAALAEKEALASRLAHRDFAYKERMAHQSATSAVLKAMSASPGDPQPVFDVIVHQTRVQCNSMSAFLFTYDGLLHCRAASSSGLSHEQLRFYLSLFPMPLDPDPTNGLARAIREQRVVHIRDAAKEGGISAVSRRAGVRSGAAMPLIKDNVIAGCLSLSSTAPGGYTDTQIELLKTFAEQAVIAITSAETYRALQARTADLQESLEYQTAISDVLKVISRSTFDLQRVLSVVAETTARLCVADQGAVYRYEHGMVRLAANFGFPAECERMTRAAEPIIPVPGHSSVGYRALLECRVIHETDVAAIPTYPEIPVKVGKQRTSLGVPLLREGRPIGLVMLARQRVEPFTERQIDLVSTFADQAVIAIENTRLLAEQREALEQQTATSEILQVINGNPGNLTPVFDALLDNALRLCDAPFGGLYIRDGVQAQGVAVRGMPPAYAAYRRDNSISLERKEHPLARCMDTAQPVEIADVATDESIYPEDRPVLMELAGVRSILDVPLVKDGRGVGAIAIYRHTPGRFAKAQVALLENFSAQAVVAMENARLLTEQREALERQTATAEVLQVINTSPGNLTPVFDAILQKATDLCAAAFGILWMFDGEHYDAAAFRNVPLAYREFLRDPPPATPLTPLGRIAAGEAFAQIADMADESFAAGGPMFNRAVELGRFRTIVGVQLRKDAGLLGAITIYRQEVRPFSDKQIVLLQNFAAQAVVAMENARLLDEIRQRQEELRVTFENMGDGVAMFDEAPRLVAWNRQFQELLDVPDGVLADRLTYEDYIHYLTSRGEYGPHVAPEDQLRHFQDRMGEHYTFERTRPNGRVLEVRHNPVEGGGFVLIYADITDRKRSEDELRAARDAAEKANRTIEAAYHDLKAAQANLIQAEKMASLGQLTAGIAHEIKNPLNFVNNFAALSVDLLDELKETAAPAFVTLDDGARADVEDLTETLTGNLRKIEEHGKRADGIVRSMLEHSRASSGERRAVDLNALVDEALNLAYHGARAQDQSFTINIQRDLGARIPPIEVSPQDITRVLLNLFSNGFYATTQRARTGEVGFEPQLKAATRAIADGVEIRVRDNGIGIPQDIRDKLFQPFFTTKPTGEGTGLGLSISYDIITKAHGGTIVVDSEEGVFTEFVVGLPCGTF
ncbi:MAG: GAF domain-containing protein [Rhodopila sp.]